MTAKQDYYAVLGVPKAADSEEIKRAFRSLARELHPDVSQDPQAEEKFREVTEAYSVLSKPATKLLYDHFGYRGPGYGWFSASPRFANAGELLDELFGRRARQRVNVVGEVQVEYFEAARGTVRTISFTTWQRCPTCEGTAAAPGATARICPGCGGTGRRRETTSSGSARLLQIDTCLDCGGAGRIASEACPTCRGSGELAAERTASVEVPAGVRDGERVALAPEPGDLGPPGEVVVRIRALPEDARLVRYAAALGLVAAIFVLIVYLLFG